MNWTKTIYYISVVSPLIGIMIYKPNVRALMRGEQLIYAYLLLCFVIDLIGYYFAVIYQNNIFITNIFYFLQVFVLTQFYRVNGINTLLTSLTGIILTILFIFAIYHRGFSNFYSDLYSLNNLFFLILAILLFVRIFKEESSLFIDQMPIFWFNLGLLTFFSGSLFTYILGLEILSNSSLTWAFHNIANILKNILFAIGLWKVRAVA